tara:strand:+ start:142 stop:804 length:663 start_codon:yes stop_codon:yes gene_type:complete
MKYWIFLVVLISSASSNFDIENCTNCEKSVLLNTGYWLSQTPIINPNSKAKIHFQNSYLIMSGFKDNPFYPKISFSTQISKNLMLSSKIFSLQVDNETPQILGAGLQYYFGMKEDTLNNLFIIQRTDIKGLEYFHLSSINIELKKWVQLNSLHLRYGVGSMFLKTSIYPILENVKRKTEEQVNYFELDCLYKNYFIDFGLGLKLSNEITSLSLNICKELF